MEVAPRTRIFGAVPNVPETFCTDTPAARPSREREISAIPLMFASLASTFTAEPVFMRRSTVYIAHEGRDDVLGAFGNVLDLEVTVQVRDAAEFRALNGHVAARDRGPVRGGGHIAPDRTVLGQCDQRRERKRQ